MGWDCTLHLVDPDAVSKGIALLVRGKPAPPALLAAYETGASMWSEAQRRVMTEPPDVAATLACQIALLLAAATHPHHAERGVALSFAVDPTPNRCGPWIPEALTASPEVLLAPLVKKRPELAGRFHRVFEHNSDTGVFVPAKHVAAAASAVRSALFDRDVAERDRYWGLYRVLRAAARHGLAYWEGTDLGVAQTRAEMIPPPSASFEWLEPLPTDQSYASSSVADGVVFLRSGEGSLAVDAREGPAVARPCPPMFSAMSSARLASGRWLTYADGAARVFEPRGGIPLECVRTVEARIPGAGGAVFVRACGEGAVLVPLRFEKRGGSPYWFDGEAVAPIGGLPDPHRGGRHGAIWYGMAATTLGCGNAAILWNGEGYEIRDGVAGEPWGLGLAVKNTCNSITPWGEDGFYFGDDQILRRARRGAPPETVAKLPDVIHELSSGPDGSVLVVHSRHLKKRTQERVATLYFPDDASEIAVSLYDLELADQLGYAGGYFWGRARKDPKQPAKDHLFRLAESAILSIPRAKLKAPK